MKVQINLKTILFYCILSVVIFCVVKITHIPFSLKDSFLILLFVILMHSLVDKRALLKKLSLKYMNQNKLIDNLFSNCPSLIYIKDENLDYIDCNLQMKKLLNIDENTSVSGKNDFDLFPSETAKILTSYDKIVIQKGQVVSYKLEKKLITGETKIYDTILAPTVQNNKISGVLGIMTDITQTEFLKEKILVKNAQLNSILDNIPFIIYLKDIEGRLITCNKILEKKLDAPVDSLIGTNLTETYFNEFLDEIKAEDARVINEKRTITFERSITFGSDIKSWYFITKSPIFNLDNEVIGIIVHFENIDADKKLQSQKETLVATLTHDLKTPTTAQMNSMKLLLNGTMGLLNDDQKEMVKLTLDSNIYMSNMISTILATYKSEDGKTVLKPESFDFAELVNATCKEVANLATTKGQNIIMISNAQSPIITADKLQIKRAVVNLVSNAITYGFEKTDIEVSISDTDKEIIMEVKNSGRYIPPKILDEIFEKYKSTENAKFNKASTGLGLYLSKQIIKEHFGEIYASSTKDEVCVFGFRIPKIFKPSAKQSKVN